MCQKCDQLTQILVEDQLVVQLMAAQQEAGLLPAVAVRPLLDHEVTARVLFGELEDDLESAVSEVTGMVEETHRGLLQGLLAELFGRRSSLTPQEAAEALAGIQADAPESIRELLTEAARRLEAVLAGVFAVAAGRVVQEFERQGGQSTMTLPILGERARVLAGPVVQRAWSWITQKATEHIAQPAVGLGGPITREALATTLDSIKPAGAVDQARQSVNAATGVARIETGSELEPSDIYASELLDGKTCRSCAAVDGTQYPDMEAATMDYPAGYYAGCSGGARCRGTILFLFKIEP